MLARRSTEIRNPALGVLYCNPLHMLGLMHQSRLCMTMAEIHPCIQGPQDVIP